MLNDYDWSLAQIQYNYLDVEHQAGRRGLRLAAERGVAVSVMEPLRGGFLTQHLPDGVRQSLAEVHPDWSLAAWALRWVWDQPEVAVTLSGMSDMAQVDENLHLAATAQPGMLEDRDRDALAEARRYFMERTKVGCTACGYCLPCPFGVAIPKVFGLYNEYHFSDAPEAKQRTRFFYSGIMGDDKPADHCTRCGACAPKCPQHIAIPDEMAKAAALFVTPAP